MQKKWLDIKDATEFKAIPGHGIEVTIEGRHVLLGNRKLMDDRNISLEELAEASDRLANEGKPRCMPQ